MLTPDRLARVRGLWEEVVNRTPPDRRVYLADACKDDPDVWEEVESLLRAHDAAGRFLEPQTISGADDELPGSTPAPVLEPGARLGPFEILALLGAGGMGQVYRARDTRLDRSVALKILSPDLAVDRRNRDRFEREARALSRLTHPHICVLLDIGRATLDDAERQFLVMELVEGETLTSRLTRGPLPVDDAIRHGIQIAEALAAAHTHGIIHRDLKPGNIMLTKSGVKLLDFGLARLRTPVAGGESVASSQSDVDAVAGTLPYMSPEQLRGGEIDARSDIFTFGVVLHEMLSSRRPFEADSRAGLIAMILERDPPRLSESHPLVPPALEGLVRACLSKEPAERWQHAHDIALELRSLQDRPSVEPVRSARSSRLWRVGGWALASLPAVAIGLLIGVRAPAGNSGDIAPRRLIFDAAPVPAGQAWSPAVSPDGRMVAFLSKPIGGVAGALYVGRLDTGETRQVTRVSDSCCAWAFGWSSDSRRLFHFAGEELRAVDVSTGSESVHAASSSLPSVLDAGVSEGSSGVILVGGPRLQRQSPDHQVLRDLYVANPAVTLQVWPSFLPNGRDFLFTQASSDPEQQGVYLGSLDTDTVVRLLPVFSNAALAPSGHVVFGKEGSILAQAFDPGTRAVSGQPAVITSGVSNSCGFTHFALGTGNTVVYVADQKAPVSALVWYDRAGKAAGSVGAPLAYRQIVMAPDGRRAVVERTDPSPAGASLWILDLARGTMAAANVTMANRKTFSGDSDPVWAPDARRIAFTAWMDNEADLFVGGINPAEPAARLASLPGMQWAKQWSHDGRFMLYAQRDSATKTSLWALPLDGERKPFVLVDSPFSNDEPQLSSDGRWLAYVSNESGRYEVYLQPFGRTGERVRLSNGGGGQPKWRADAQELFYVTPDGTIMSVPVGLGEPGKPRALFHTPLQPAPMLDEYAVTPDGQRFLIISPERSTGSARLSVLSNWPALLPQ